MTVDSRSKTIALLVPALIFGLAIAWIDSRPGWDDSGVSAMLVLCSTAILGAAMPKRAWLWALAVGIWIPLLGLTVSHNTGSLLALVIAFAGAYAGALGRIAIASLARART